MTKKFYAVRNGFKIGIFDTWEECKDAVSGFSGAEYKSFSALADAEEYLGAKRKTPIAEKSVQGTATAYVDGSYNSSTGIFGCGVVIFHDTGEASFSQFFKDPNLASMRNVAGEIEGAKLAMRFCADNNIKNLDIYYDYEGIEKWCSGAWKTNKEGTIAYKRFYDEISKKITVSFKKVKGHSGDKYNDLADSLAKKAVGIQ